jgi:hypothetical protein
MATQAKLSDVFSDFDIPYELDINAWRAACRELSRREEITQWEIGDLLLECEEHGKLTGREKAFACRTFKRVWPVLKNYKSLSSQFPREPKDGSPSLRSDALSYSAYRLLGPFSRENRDKLLAYAQACEEKDGHQVTVDQLRDHIRLEQKIGRLQESSDKPYKPKSTPQLVKLGFYCTREEYWRLCRLAKAIIGKDKALDFLKWMADKYFEEHKDEFEARLQEYERQTEQNVVGAAQ